VPDNLEDLAGITPANDSEHYYCVDATSFEINRGILRGTISGDPEKTQLVTYFEVC
jgi:hypothetical protein